MAPRGMGVKGLQEFLESEPILQAGVSTVDLVRSSWAREGKVTAERKTQCFALMKHLFQDKDTIYGFI